MKTKCKYTIYLQQKILLHNYYSNINFIQTILFLREMYINICIIQKVIYQYHIISFFLFINFSQVDLHLMSNFVFWLIPNIWDLMLAVDATKSMASSSSWNRINVKSINIFCEIILIRRANVRGLSKFC